MRLGLGLAIGALLVGCVMASPTTRPTPSASATASTPAAPSPSVAASPPLASALPLAWVLGTEGVPEPSPGLGAVGCFQPVSVVQQGDRLKLSWDSVCLGSEEVSGPWQANQAHLEGVRFRGRLSLVSRWDLTYHPETGHLTGTHNGEPVWLVPGHGCPSPASMCAIRIQGLVYDQDGRLVQDKATVTIKSSNPSEPFAQTIQVVGGRYVSDYAPYGIGLDITAQVEGEQPVTRHETVTRGPVWDVNFGGPRDEIDPEGWKYWAEPIPSPPVGPSGAPQ